MTFNVKRGINLNQLNTGIKNLSTDAKLKAQAIKSLDASLKVNNLEEKNNVLNEQKPSAEADGDVGGGGSNDLNDQSSTLQIDTGAIGSDIESDLMPALSTVADFINSSLSPAIQQINDLFTNLSQQNKELVTDILAVTTAFTTGLETFAQVNDMISKFSTILGIAKTAITLLDLSINATTGGLILLFSALAAVLLQNEEFQAILQDLFDILQVILTPVVSLIKLLVDQLMPVLTWVADIVTFFMALFKPIMDAFSKMHKAINAFLIKPFNALIKVINLIIKGINFLLKGLSIITFGAIKIQIPELPEFDTDASLGMNDDANANGTQSYSNNVVFNNSYHISKEVDANQVVEIVNNQLGRTLR